jgi:hypothetical protein
MEAMEFNTHPKGHGLLRKRTHALSLPMELIFELATKTR